MPRALASATSAGLAQPCYKLVPTKKMSLHGYTRNKCVCGSLWHTCLRLLLVIAFQTCCKLQPQWYCNGSVGSIAPLVTSPPFGTLPAASATTVLQHCSAHAVLHLSCFGRTVRTYYVAAWSCILLRSASAPCSAWHPALPQHQLCRGTSIVAVPTHNH